MLKRLQLLEEAYRGRPAQPSVEGADHFLGVTEANDGSLVDPELKKHAAAKLKEVDVKREQRKWMEEVRLRDSSKKSEAGPKAKAGAKSD